MNKLLILAIVLGSILVLVAGAYLVVGSYEPAAEPVATTTESTHIEDKVLPYGPVTLRFGETARFDGLTVTPLSLVEDSRCAKGVQCIQAGTVRVRTQIVSGMGTSTDVIALGNTITTEAEAVTLQSVSPEAIAGVAINPSDYRLTYSVSKRANTVAAPIAPPAPAKCYVGGCSSQICSDTPDMVSTCEYREEYACYQNARCERQASGECGWTMTSDLQMCLAQ